MGNFKTHMHDQSKSRLSAPFFTLKARFAHQLLHLILVTPPIYLSFLPISHWNTAKGVAGTLVAVLIFPPLPLLSLTRRQFKHNLSKP